jgi:acyl carrier protein
MTNTAIDLAPIRDILARHGRLTIPIDHLKENSNLYDAGLTSLATVGVMLALEEHFDIEFPEKMLSRKTFESLGAIADAVAQITA